MERRIRRTWRGGERVTFYERTDGRWKRVRDNDEGQHRWEQPGSVPVFTEFDLPYNDPNSAMMSSSR